MGAPRERLMTPWSDWAAPGSAQELLGVLGAPLGAPGNACLGLLFCGAHECLERLGTLGSRSTAWAAPGPRLRRAWGTPGKRFGKPGERLGRPWGPMRAQAYPGW